jgi:hypothetical protein
MTTNLSERVEFNVTMRPRSFEGIEKYRKCHVSSGILRNRKQRDGSSMRSPRLSKFEWVPKPWSFVDRLLQYPVKVPFHVASLALSCFFDVKSSSNGWIDPLQSEDFMRIIECCQCSNHDITAYFYE